jgi:hypothetical protein
VKVYEEDLTSEKYYFSVPEPPSLLIFALGLAVVGTLTGQRDKVG